MAYGKSIELFLVNGTADSLVTAELSNWNGRVFMSKCNLKNKILSMLLVMALVVTMIPMNVFASE